MHQYQIILKRCNFFRNKSFNGGVIAQLANVVSAVSDSTFTYNNAMSGGVIYLDKGNKLTVNNSLLSHNSAESNGGVIYCSDHNQVTFYNPVVTFNNADNNGGVVCSLIETELYIIGDMCNFTGN